MPTAAAPMARFCGEIILPSTPPELLAAAMRVGSRFAFFAAVTWSAPNSEFDAVSEPVIDTPSHPIQDENTAKMLPAPATHMPSVMVWPDRFITYAIASTLATVRIAHLSCFSVFQ